MKITILPYTDACATEITDLHHACVHAIDPHIYSREQQEAWAHTPPNYPYWVKRLALKKPFMAMVEATIVGFIELEDNGHIDCAYTHPAYQKRGVMSELFAYTQNLAEQKGIKRLYLEASIVAKPFFEKRGFKTLHRNEIKRNGQMIVNFSMEKMLS
ncbi:GNAT family N-acetyltransferase [Sulfurospirillum diekertiae]|uniref:N-acetyltransferase YafP n=2 Tax=Sulfurospirillum diekertiae TaxID=1854492 RepID=A0A1Y0HS39_9BACT|nr:GNAT family N-acetyltransferase [Sulfurospirillum diekertiae]ARU49983.1 putative N-acetyltransferase YafP [Sulfurospirillum diekertiae]ASC94773.1 putative N-acetyltransferase YafP [Sulfurospirillum diekertiae]